MDDSLLDKFKQKDTIEKLRIQNEDFVKHYQELKCQNKELELQKITLLKENYELMIERNKYRNYAYKLKNIVNNVAINITKELNDVKRVTEDFNKMDRNNKSIPDMESNNTPEISPTLKNINHVRPMIRGYTIKNPFIVVSRNISNSHLGQNVNTRRSANNNSSRTEASSGTIEVDNSPQELELLNLCVSLRRIDGTVKMRNLKKEKINMENSFSIPTDEDVNDNIVSMSPSTHIVSAEEELNDNCIYGDDGVNNELSESQLSYSQQKELSVIPENPDENYESLDDQCHVDVSKPNKFVVSPSSFKKRNHKSIDIDDPLEGPSWLYDCKDEDNQSKIKDDDKFSSIPENKFVVMRKKKRIETITDTYQSPDSTSEIIENVIPQSKYPYHSTPYQSRAVQKLDFFSDKTNSIIKDAKIVISKLENDLSPRQVKCVKSPRKNKTAGKNKQKEVKIEPQSLHQDVQLTSRPRRNAVKSYKEAPLNIKLRRD